MTETTDRHLQKRTTASENHLVCTLHKNKYWPQILPIYASSTKKGLNTPSKNFQQICVKQIQQSINYRIQVVGVQVFTVQFLPFFCMYEIFLHKLWGGEATKKSNDSQLRLKFCFLRQLGDTQFTLYLQHCKDTLDNYNKMPLILDIRPKFGSI